MDRNLRDICLRIIQLSNGQIGNLRLQKLLYFVQAYSLVRFGQEAYHSNIEAWPYGPVVPEAYFAFKNNLLENRIERVGLNQRNEESVSVVMDAFRNWSDFALVDLTHKYEIWQNKLNSIYADKVIEVNEIRTYHEQRNFSGGIF